MKAAPVLLARQQPGEPPTPPRCHFFARFLPLRELATDHADFVQYWPIYSLVRDVSRSHCGARDPLHRLSAVGRRVVRGPLYLLFRTNRTPASTFFPFSPSSSPVIQDAGVREALRPRRVIRLVGGRLCQRVFRHSGPVFPPGFGRRDRSPLVACFAYLGRISLFEARQGSLELVERIDRFGGGSRAA